MTSFTERDNSRECSFNGRAVAFESDVFVGRLRIAAGSEHICFRESSLLCVCSEGTLCGLLPYIELIGTPTALVCACELPKDMLLKAVFKKMPCFVLESGSRIPCDADGKIALIDARKGRLILDPRLDTLDLYLYSHGKIDVARVSKRRLSAIFDAEYLREYLNQTVRADGSMICDADDVATLGDFFETTLSLAERLTTGSLCMRISVFDKRGEDLFCERAEALFRAAVYGTLSVMLQKYRSIDDIDRALRLMYKSYCRLEQEGREVNAYLEKGLLIDSPIWLLDRKKLPCVDFLCFDFDSLCIGLMGRDIAGAVDDSESMKTVCKFWEEYRHSNLPEKAELRAKSEEFFDSKLFADWVEFMDIKEIYLPKNANGKKILDND